MEQRQSRVRARWPWPRSGDKAYGALGEVFTLDKLLHWEEHRATRSWERFFLDSTAISCDPCPKGIQNKPYFPVSLNWEGSYCQREEYPWNP